MVWCGLGLIPPPEAIGFGTDFRAGFSLEATGSGPYVSVSNNAGRRWGTRQRDLLAGLSASRNRVREIRAYRMTPALRYPGSELAGWDSTGGLTKTAGPFSRYHGPSRNDP